MRLHPGLPPVLQSGTLGLLAVLLISAGSAPSGEPAAVKVTIEDEKPTVVEAALPVDPTPRVRYTPSSKMNLRIRDQQNRTLHLSHFPVLKIDEQVLRSTAAGLRFEKNNLAFNKKAAGRMRQGHESVLVYNDLRLTMVAEVAVARPAPGNKERSLGTVLIRYTVENVGK
jgi:hypothetical protein